MSGNDCLHGFHDKLDLIPVRKASLNVSAFLVQNGFRDRDELANQTYRIIVHFWVIFCTKKPKSKRLPIYPNLEKYCRDRDRLANPSLYYNFLIIFAEIKSSFA